MEFLTALSVADQVTTVAILIGVAVLVITDKLVWHTRLKSERERADRWERAFIDGMSKGGEAGVAAAETAAAIVAALPDPARKEG